ncbi:hypothetical protein Trydic_g16310 [Trypoxylus dichotomus]
MESQIEPLKLWAKEIWKTATHLTAKEGLRSLHPGKQKANQPPQRRREDNENDPKVNYDVPRRKGTDSKLPIRVPDDSNRL